MGSFVICDEKGTKNLDFFMFLSLLMELVNRKEYNTDPSSIMYQT